MFSCSVLSNSLWPHGLQYASMSFTISQSLFKLLSIKSEMPFNHLILSHPLPLLPSIFPSIRAFSNESSLHQVAKVLGVSASASVLPLNIQDWFPIRWTGLISLQSKGLSRVLSNTTVQKHQFFCALWDPMDYIVHGILQARILEWVAVPFSRGSSKPRDQTQVSRIAGAFFTIWDTREVQRGGMVTRGRLVGGRQRGWRKASLTRN